MVVKTDTHWNIVQEAEDLLWLRKNTKVRVPNLYAMFSDNLAPATYYLVYEYIPGEKIDSKTWWGLSDAQREKIYCSVEEQIRLLRSVPAEGHYGRINGQGFDPDVYAIRTNGKGVCAPFKTYKEYVDAQCLTAEVGAVLTHNMDESDDLRPEQQAFLAALKPTLLSWAESSKPKLTHVDPTMQNWVVRPLDGSMQDASDYEVTLIDWCRLGWFPAYVQRIAFGNITSFYDREKGIFLDEELENSYARIEQYFPGEDYEEQWQFAQTCCKYALLSLR
jgi:hypothetical protein